MEVTEDKLVSAIRRLIQEESTKQNNRTVKQLVAEYWEVYARHLKSHRKIRGYLDRELIPHFGDLKLSELCAQRIERWFRNKSDEAPTSANRAYEVLRGMLNKGIHWGYLETNPANGIRKNRENKRKRYLSRSELTRLLQYLSEHEPQSIETLIKLFLLTGIRHTPLRRLRWEQVCLLSGYIYLDNTKNGEDWRVPLSAYAAELLAKLPRSSVYVFPGRWPGSCLDLDKIWQRIRIRTRLDDVTVHDLRRTCGSILAQAQVSDRTIGEVLGQRSKEAVEHYAYITDEQPRNAVEIVSLAVKQVDTPGEC
jgi:integrase